MTGDPADSIARPGQGTLFVVATPIGNLADLSVRARDVLRDTDLLLAEDTRHTRQLLNACGIERSRGALESLHEHNEPARVPGLVERLLGGASVALVSDAGTPLVSDPGAVLVQAAAAAGDRGRGRARPVRGDRGAVRGRPAGGTLRFRGIPAAEAGGAPARARSAGRRGAHAGVLRGPAPAGRDARGPRCRRSARIARPRWRASSPSDSRPSIAARSARWHVDRQRIRTWCAARS